MNERDVEDAVMSNPEVAFGLAAPDDQSPDLEYQELSAMTWSLIVPRGHKIAGRGGCGWNNLYASRPI